jgi:hypothetical protein
VKKLLTALAITTVMVGCAADEDTRVDTAASFFSENGAITSAENYPTHETSRQILLVQEAVGVNVIAHKRQLTPTDNQPVVRMNRDTYYSQVVVDISEGATITLPEFDGYMSAQVVTEDHRIQPMVYGPGTYPLDAHTGNHVFIIVRLDATLSEAEAARIQDEMSVDANSAEPFMAEPIQEASFEAVERELRAQMPAILQRDGDEALYGMFTAPSDDSDALFTPEKYSVGAAVGWGGAQLIDNIYEISPNFPADVCHEVTFEDPENGAFWSITVYNETGFMFSDLANLSSDTAEPNADGTYTVRFGCGVDAVNNIETANDSGLFNLAIRHYQPSQKVIDGYRLLPFVAAVE